MSELKVSTATAPLRGQVSVPADKSITHRALMLAPLANGETRIENYLDSETTRATLNCMRALGVDIKPLVAHTLLVRGGGLTSLREPPDILFCLGSGTTMRLLAGLCAGQDFLSILDGTPALKRRPMGRVAEPLREMGATILARDDNKLPPLVIRGGNLRGINYTMPVASAQVKSAVLLAGLFADAPTTVHEPAPSRDHTERILRSMGVEVRTSDTNTIRIKPPSALIAQPAFLIPADFSSAAFFVVAALLVPHSEICLTNVGLNHTRTGLLDALTRMGAIIKIENAREINGEPVGDIIVQSVANLVATDTGGEEIPRMIDELPILAVAATQGRGETHVRDAEELRVKESDRIATLAQELRKLGAHIEERADGFSIKGPTPLQGARVDAHNDHRLAMSLAVAGMLARGETVIEGWECVADSFPNFQHLLTSLTGQTSAMAIR